MGFGGFSRHQDREQTYRKRRGGGGKFHWRQQWRPPLEEENPRGEPFLFIPANYKDPRDPTKEIPYYPYLEHSVLSGGNFLGSFLCSRGHDEFSQNKCNGCYAEENKPPQGVTVKQRIFAAVGGVVLTWWHLVPVVDEDTGQVKTYSRGENAGKPVMDKVPCEGRGCQHCAERHERVFGAKRYQGLGPNHLDNLFSIDRELLYSCSCGGELTATQYMCRHCMTPLLDLEADAEKPPHEQLTNDQIAKFASSPRTCPACGARDEPFEICSCSSCNEPTRLCLDPIPGGVPAIIWLKKTGKGTSSAISMVKAMAATNYKLPTDDEPLLVVDTDPETGADLLHWHKDVEPYMKQFDFENLLTTSDDARTLNMQAEQIKKAWKGFRSPHMAGASGDQVRDYQRS